MLNAQVQVSAVLAQNRARIFHLLGGLGETTEKRKISYILLGIEPRFFGFPAHSLVTTLTELLYLPE